MLNLDLSVARQLLKSALSKPTLQQAANLSLELLDSGEEVTNFEQGNDLYQSSITYAEIYDRRYSSSRLDLSKVFGVRESIDSLRLIDRLAKMQLIQFNSSIIVYWIEKDTNELCGVILLKSK